jgi:hypothetical protein
MINNMKDLQTKMKLPLEQKTKRKLGILEGKATFSWVRDGKITLEEFGINFNKFDKK